MLGPSLDLPPSLSFIYFPSVRSTTQLGFGDGGGAVSLASADPSMGLCKKKGKKTHPGQKQEEQMQCYYTLLWGNTFQEISHILAGASRLAGCSRT